MNDQFRKTLICFACIALFSWVAFAEDDDFLFDPEIQSADQPETGAPLDIDTKSADQNFDTAEAEKLDDVLGLSDDQNSQAVNNTNEPPRDVSGAETTTASEELPEIAKPVPVVQTPVFVSPAPKWVAEAPPKDVVANPKALEISDVRFYMEGRESILNLSANGVLQFSETRSPETNQIVLIVTQALIDQKLQKAYDTSEFSSPVAMFTVFQLPNEASVPVVKIIVQLKEFRRPMIKSTGQGVEIRFPASVLEGGPKVVIQDKEEKTDYEENIYSSNKKFSGEILKRLEVKNSDIQDVLRLIAKSSGYNIVVGDEVQGKVGTLSLQNIPWDQAFTLVLQTKKLGYIRQGAVIRVGTLAALKSEKEEAISNEQSRVRVEPLKTVLIPINFAKASELSPRAKSFLSERGSVDTDDRTNTLIIKDIETVVGKVQKLISMLDSPPPRVSISGKIVEMQSQFVRDLGFQNTSFNETLAGLDIGHAVATGASGASTTVIRSKQAGGFNTEFKLGELESKVKILANPTVSVVANKNASISSTLSFFRPVSTSTPSGTATSYTDIKATLSLDVTPIVSGDGNILLSVNVKNEIPISVGSSEIKINQRTMSTQVLIENGDTAVIGGLFQNNYTMTRQGTSFFNRIPLLGFLFDGSNVNDQSTEVFVFLTAQILNADESLRRVVGSR